MSKYIFYILIVFAVSGCATSNFTAGRDFNIENVKEIVKGETTTDDLLSLFGEPYSKTVMSNTDEKWFYFYTNTTSKATSYIVSMDVETSGTQKALDVLISEGTVSNYTFNDGKTPYTMKVN
jgi:outer membrane protein assembly factor BamE (lipoprotein component of BamABCDE complex)